MSTESCPAADSPLGGVRPPPTDANLNNLSQEYLYEDLVAATDGFGTASRLGMGTYGSVFQGTLRDGTEVAVKALCRPNESGFREEVEVLSRFRHPNLVILMGFARKTDERYLVYELLPGGDVCARLQKDPNFDWRQRLNVALDAALGLSHLHGSRPQVFHRDIKTQNILMDRNGTGKMADFGLAMLAKPDCRSLTVENTSGTIGYADPQYIRTGRVTEASEVYSFGTVLLEILTGQPPALQYPDGHIEYQFTHINGELSRVRDMLDPRGRWPPGVASLVGSLALRCIHEQQGVRPSFTEIVNRLRRWLKEHAEHPVGHKSPEQQFRSTQPAQAALHVSNAGKAQAAAAAGINSGASSSSSSKNGNTGDGGSSTFAFTKARAVAEAGAAAANPEQQSAARAGADGGAAAAIHQQPLNLHPRGMAGQSGGSAAVPLQPKPREGHSTGSGASGSAAVPLQPKPREGNSSGSVSPGATAVPKLPLHAAPEAGVSSSSPSNARGWGTNKGSVKLDLSFRSQGVSAGAAPPRVGSKGSPRPLLTPDLEPFGSAATSKKGARPLQLHLDSSHQEPAQGSRSTPASGGSPRPVLGPDLDAGVKQVPLLLAGWGASPTTAASKRPAALSEPGPGRVEPAVIERTLSLNLESQQQRSAPAAASAPIGDRLPPRGPPPTEAVTVDCGQDKVQDLQPGFHLDDDSPPRLHPKDHDSPRACLDCGPPGQGRSPLKPQQSSSGQQGACTGTSVSTRASTGTGSSVCSTASVGVKSGSTVNPAFRASMRGARSFLLGNRAQTATPEVLAKCNGTEDPLAHTCPITTLRSAGAGVGALETKALHRQSSAGSLAQAEETVARLQALGFSEMQASEACKRCSTVEGAIDWILSPERPWSSPHNHHH